MKSEQIKEITEKAAEQLVAALQAGRSEALTMYFKAIGRFHRYSLHNVLLIASQKLNASYVAGFRTWNGLGRFVKKGEKGIMILAPIFRRKAHDDHEVPEEISRPITGFRAAFVFDISQTDGKELPQIVSWQGRFEEALAESELARKLDPLSLIIATDHGAILYFSRQYDRAIEQFRSVLAMDPSFTRVHLIIFAYVQARRFADALAEAENIRRFDGEGAWYWSSLAYVHGSAGQQAQARRALEKLEQQAPRLQSQPAWTPMLLSAYLGTRRKDDAIALLQKTCEQHSNAVVTLKVDPGYDALRGDPRFQDLLRSVRLVPSLYCHRLNRLVVLRLPMQTLPEVPKINFRYPASP